MGANKVNPDMVWVQNQTQVMLMEASALATLLTQWFALEGNQGPLENQKNVNIKQFIFKRKYLQCIIHNQHIVMKCFKFVKMWRFSVWLPQEILCKGQRSKYT